MFTTTEEDRVEAECDEIDNMLAISADIARIARRPVIEADFDVCTVLPGNSEGSI